MNRIQKARELVSKYMGNSSIFDASHDMNHVERVVKMALYLAEKEGITDPSTLEIIEVAALLHDMNDHKYKVNDSDTGVKLRPFLLDIGFAEPEVNRIMHVVENVSYSTELKDIKVEAAKRSTFDNEAWEYAKQYIKLSYNFDIQECNCDIKSAKFVYRNPFYHTPELCVVQDADRLDALGAIGIARCLYFSGTRKNPIYNIDNSSDPKTAIGHFYDKLLNLQYLMKTEEGKKLAIERTKIMSNFVSMIQSELELK